MASSRDTTNIRGPEWAPVPRFHVGSPVRVLLNERNATPWVGRVRLIVWHHRQAQWMFYLQAGDRKVSKRYWSDDLEWFDEAPLHGVGACSPAAGSG